MESSRRQRKKERTRMELVDCAVALFKEKGFAETSIDEITEKADISRGTLYNYFEDKEAILAAYFQNKVTGAAADVPARLASAAGIRARLRIMLELMAQILTDDLDLVMVYFKVRLRDLGSPSGNTRRTGMEPLIVEILRAAQEQGEIRPDLPPLVIAKNLHFFFMNFFAFNLYEKKAAEKPLEMEQAIDLFLNGAGARPSAPLEQP